MPTTFVDGSTAEIVFPEDLGLQDICASPLSPRNAQPTRGTLLAWALDLTLGLGGSSRLLPPCDGL